MRKRDMRIVPKTVWVRPVDLYNYPFYQPLVLKNRGFKGWVGLGWEETERKGTTYITSKLRQLNPQSKPANQGT